MILKEAREQALRAFNTSIDVNVLTKAINDYDEFKTAKWLDQDGKRHLFHSLC